MTFKFKCPFCGQTLEAECEWTGELTECPRCRRQFNIPENISSGPRMAKAVAADSASENIPPPVADSGGKRFIFICPECGEVSEMNERKLGRTVTCRFCGEEVTVTRTETRSCPKCGEEIKINATVCKYCRRQIPPLRPRSAASASGGGANIPPRRSYGDDTGDGGTDAAATEKLFRNFFWMTIAGWGGLAPGVLLVICGLGMYDSVGATIGTVIFIFGMLLLLPSSLMLVATAIMQFILLYRYWKLIPDEPNPLQRVLFLLIPLFNLYWVFRAYAELGKRLENETGSGGDCRAATLGMIWAIAFDVNVVLAYPMGWIVTLAVPVISLLSMRAFHKEARRLMS